MLDEGAVWLETAMPKESASAKPARPAGPELPKDFKPSGAEQKAIAWREANLVFNCSNRHM